MTSDKEDMKISYVNEVYELHQQASNLIDSNPANALKIARKIQNYGSNCFIAYTVSGLFIDIGSRLNDEELIKEGILLLQNNLTEITSKKKLLPTAYYNLANGFSCLFGVKRGKNPLYGYFEDTEVRQAKEFFRKALEQRIDNSQLKSQIYVNLGNCCDEVGRAVEAQDCYTEALKLNPKHGMALGNKGQGLFFYAALSGEHQGTILKEAHKLLSQAIEMEITQDARITFIDYIRRIELRIKNKQFFNQSFDDYPGYKIQAENALDEFLIKFCLEHKLYLNICNFCQRCDDAIGDTAIIRKMIAKPNDYNALFDIHRDLENGAYVTLRYSRNALTHRFLNVKAKVEKQDEENMLEETLFQKTTELAKIVRSAIIYVLFFIYLSENVKEKTLKGEVLPLEVNDLPDSLRKRL